MTTTDVKLAGGPGNGMTVPVFDHLDEVYCGPRREDNDYMPNYFRSSRTKDTFVHYSVPEADVTPESPADTDAADDDFDVTSYLMGIRDLCDLLLEADGNEGYLA